MRNKQSGSNEPLYRKYLKKEREYEDMYRL